MRWMMLLLLCLGLPAQADLDYRLAPRQIAEGTWLLEGSTDNFGKANGGNIVNTAFIVTDSGVVVIDSGPSKRYGDALRQAIAATTDKPVLEVLLTHHHPDHVLGNQGLCRCAYWRLGPVPATCCASRARPWPRNMYRLVGDWMRGTEVVLPTQVLQPGIHEVGGHRLRLLELGGHTGADLAILDEKTGVLFAGDLVFYERALTTPNSPGLEVWQKDLDTLQALPWKLLVPGHGPVASDARPFAQMRDYLGWLDGLMRDGAARGDDMAEMIRSPIPERFAGITLTRYELIRSVSHLYPRYERQQLQRVDANP
uniref:Metallo-beta-lactamase domain-containing protein n=1 Tax=Pseudomonas putida TaxID=303 RepID=B1N7J4_PSEPU|nr:hypothetical protein [Pseudomonas putida]